MVMSWFSSMKEPATAIGSVKPWPRGRRRRNGVIADGLWWPIHSTRIFLFLLTDVKRSSSTDHAQSGVQARGGFLHISEYQLLGDLSSAKP